MSFLLGLLDGAMHVWAVLSLCRGILGIAVQWRNLNVFGYSFSEPTLEHIFCSESSSVSLSALYLNRFRLRHWTAIPKIPRQRDREPQEQRLFV
jgi:hypothetical protein